jgi:anti-anti-sigma factor
MKIDVQNYNTVAVLSLQGEFTREAIKSFEDVVSAVLSGSKIEGLVLDMSKVVMLDSETLTALLDLNDRCQDNLRQMKLAGLDETCRKILEITRLLEGLDIYADPVEAVKSFA